MKDPELDYEIDSDEEWEDEEPGECLSDCDKDEVESLDEECARGDGEESEDGFFVQIVISPRMGGFKLTKLDLMAWLRQKFQK
ncbi:PREDICTED: chromatin assembly factor 1 subunit FAS1-like [Ipomoea nil]|uniref:chromatin assembly factor 1 subunit FAS1-like n=1 Tax=Ipomoea nil TaxID=35883 RepID=UPI0009017914|nr:PREDICTED: chromatin assembly factor 1 subunit FAS1-like [Ipomoea nil]